MRETPLDFLSDIFSALLYFDIFLHDHKLQFSFINSLVNMAPLNIQQLLPDPGKHERNLEEDCNGRQDEGQLVGGGEALHEGQLVPARHDAVHGGQNQSTPT